jgi:hypothetical protein
MEFSGQYLTYEEYKGLGGTIDLTPFNLLEFEARRKIDIRTQDRLKGFESNEIPQEVKLCDLALINMVKKYANQENNENQEKQNIASETTDGYSVTYNTITLDKIKEIMESKKAEVNDILNTYLVGVIFNGEHIAYLGVK